MTQPNLQFVYVDTNFAEWLRSARRKAHLTMEVLARKIGKSKQYISVLERGEPHVLTGKPVTPKKAVVESLASALNADVDEALAAAGYASQTQTPPEQVEIIEILNHSTLTANDYEQIKKFIEFLDASRK